MEEQKYLIDHDGATVILVREWMAKKDADELCHHLRETVKWEKHEVKIGGRMIMQPRRIYVCGDRNVNYTYSGLTLVPHEWIPDVKTIAEAITQQTNVDLNTCLLNEYENGSSYIGWHSDKEVGGPVEIVATVSLGGSRDFYFRPKTYAPDSRTGEMKPLGKEVKTTLHSGDAVVMYGRTQDLYTHSIPKRAHADYRISLTFRHIVG